MEAHVLVIGKAGARATGAADEQLALLEALLRFQELVALLRLHDVQSIGADVAGGVANGDEETVALEGRDREHAPFLTGEPSVGRRGNPRGLLERDEKAGD